MTPARVPFLRAASVRHWLRLLLLCAVFSALQATVGGWVVSAVGREDVVQVCTPQGLQWVRLEEGKPGQDKPATLLQPCVWAAAHVAMVPPWLPAGKVPDRGSAVTPTWGGPAAPPSDHARRVLLMSAMRAPPQLPGLA